MTRRLPWLGLLLAASAWAVSHQVASDSIFDACNRGQGAFVLLVCLLALAVDVGGGIFSLAVWRGANGHKGTLFLGMLGLLLALLCGYAIVLQTFSVLIIPPCAA